MKTYAILYVEQQAQLGNKDLNSETNTLISSETAHQGGRDW